jgi:hypothetical protein
MTNQNQQYHVDTHPEHYPSKPKQKYVECTSHHTTHHTTPYTPHLDIVDVDGELQVFEDDAGYLGLVGILRGVHQEVGVDIPQGDGGHGDGRPEVLRQGPLDGLDAGEDGWMDGGCGGWVDGEGGGGSVSVLPGSRERGCDW